MNRCRSLVLFSVAFLWIWTGPPLLAQEGALKEILDQIPTYQGIVEGIRGEKFRKDVPASFQGAEDFLRFVEESLDRDLPPERLDGWSRSLEKMGLLPADFDMRAGLVEFVTTQAGAYYDPEKEAFFVVMGELDESLIRSVVVHELQHALQDQLFDLDAMMDRARESKSTDAESAIAFAVEGEATYLMTLDQMEQEMGVAPGKRGSPVVEMALNMQRRIDVRVLGDLAAGMMGPGGGGPDMDRALKALKTMPYFLVRSFLDPYTWGAYAIARVHTKKGWEGVSALFRDPPPSTEMLMHPEKLIERDDLPREVAVPEISGTLGPGWKRVYEDTFGEHGILILLDESLQDPPKREGGAEPDLQDLARLFSGEPTPGEDAAAGWGGDRYSLYEHRGGASVLAWVTTWDTEEDARQFFGTYLEAVRKKFGPTSLEAPEGTFREVIGSDLETEIIFGALRGKDVIVLFAPVTIEGKAPFSRLVESRGETE